MTYLFFFIIPQRYINRKKLVYKQIIGVRNIAALGFLTLVAYRSTWAVRNNMIYL